MKRLKPTIFVIAFLAPCLLTAAQIKLKDGSVLIGDVINSSGGVYIISMRTGGNQINVPVSDVVDIVEDPARALLRFRGSNTVGERLIPDLVDAFVQRKGGAGAQWSTGTMKTEKTLRIGAPKGGLPDEIEVQAHGSSTAFRELKARGADIGMSSRPIKPEEVVDLIALGDMTSPESEHVIALDGLAVIVHPSNPVQALSKEEIARIFSGVVTDWSQVGGPPGAIQCYARDDNSGTYDSFKTMILDPQRLSLGGGCRRFESSSELSDSVAKDKLGIGFIGLPYIREAKALEIRECGLSYRPSPFFVKTEEYPLSRRLFLYTPSTSTSRFSPGFVDFALSDTGQETTKKAGFVSLGIETEAQDPAEANSARLARVQAAVLSLQRTSILQDFVRSTQDAVRLSVTFRFRLGKSDLDSRAIRDVKRLAAFMKSPLAKGRHVMLFGFSDDQGDFDRNLELSLARAQTVAALLRREGVELAAIKAFGEEVPVACNTSEEGYTKNRHVEVWVR